MRAHRMDVTSRTGMRQNIAFQFGATDSATERADEGVDRINDMTAGPGPHFVTGAVWRHPPDSIRLIQGVQGAAAPVKKAITIG